METKTVTTLPYKYTGHPSGSLDFVSAHLRLKKVVNRTPLTLNQNLSKKYQCNVYLKREDLQIVRSYKLRGAYNMMSSLSPEKLRQGVVCASAGNHAQGFAYSCKKLNTKGVVFMPVITPKQKVNQVKMFGGQRTDILECLRMSSSYHKHQTVGTGPALRLFNYLFI